MDDQVMEERVREHAFLPVDWSNTQGFRGTSASCGCGWTDGYAVGFEDYMDAYRQWVDEHLLAELKRLRGELTSGRALIEAADKVAIKSEDDAGWITGYQFKTGAWHRLLAWARR